MSCSPSFYYLLFTFTQFLAVSSIIPLPQLTAIATTIKPCTPTSPDPSSQPPPRPPRHRDVFGQWCHPQPAPPCTPFDHPVARDNSPTSLKSDHHHHHRCRNHHRGTRHHNLQPPSPSPPVTNHHQNSRPPPP
ncbi:putative formin-like protein 5 [Iris pallida]|uniref:Formin-like protein 5 n=1 Tax=Iris pallida TaxID=29817 RepID=A0AAX6H3B7_IRIPA|nr:putative formin-like protein 5 [Iris pallida]